MPLYNPSSRMGKHDSLPSWRRLLAHEFSNYLTQKELRTMTLKDIRRILIVRVAASAAQRYGYDHPQATVKDNEYV
jgi:hypothetical protein